MTSTSFTLELPHVTVSGIRRGRGPGVLYIHDELGFAWTPFLDVLAETFEVTAIELPGFGNSERPEWAEAIDDYAFIVADLVDIFVVEGSLALVGAGLGGWLALEAVIRGAPASALVVIGAPGVDIPGDPPVDYFVLTPDERAPLFFEDPDCAPQVDEDSAIRNESMTARLVWQPRYFSPNLQRRLHRVSIPTLVVWGERDRFLSQAHGEAIANGVTNGRLEVIPEVGHFPVYENPLDTGKLVRNYLFDQPGLQEE